MALMDGATDNGAQNTPTDLSVDDVAELFQKRPEAKDAEKPSKERDGDDLKKKPTETPADDQDDEEDDVDGEDADDENAEAPDADGEEDEDDGKEPIVADPEAVVEVKVGDEIKKLKVKDLTRLAGQEAALTQKSQQLASERKTAADTFEIAKGAYETLLTKAQQNVEKYRNLDWMKIGQSLAPEQAKKLRAEAQAAEDHFKFLATDAREFAKKADAHAAEVNRAAAVQAVEYVQKHIPNWNASVYSEVRKFATDAGIDASDFDQIVSGPAIVLVHDAMLYRRAKAQAKTVTKKVDLSPKNSVTPKPTAGTTRTDKTAMSRLASSGSVEDAAAVFASRSNMGGRERA